ncbi:hypothetical protein QAD02_022042 [Eretmocerus hayati]|uniref:Uncharacterized protein n=1 Tax=Eretmocerus hayati TaxID=131215 RepID=A0ACC2PTD3_9HYME|nr:hypothetical protein QAD02_022042 [Eretmocerus hayati]
MGKAKPCGTRLPPTEIPQFITNLLGKSSNQVPGKTNILERNTYLKDNPNSNSKINPSPLRPSRSRDKKINQNSKSYGVLANIVTKMDVGPKDAPNTATNKLYPMKRPADDTIDYPTHTREYKNEYSTIDSNEQDTSEDETELAPQEANNHLTYP